MIRVIHSQAQPGDIYLSDVEDGVRFASHHGLDNAKRQTLKQKTHVPFANPSDVTQPGYTDLVDSDQALLSLNHGVIGGLVTKGWATVQFFVPSDIVAPTVTLVQYDTPTAGDITITGTKFLSLPPDVSMTVITGTGAKTLTRTQIIAGTGTFTDTSIVIPVALLTSVASSTSSIKVVSDHLSSVVTPLIGTPVLTTAFLNTTLTLTGRNFLSLSPATSSVVITGDGAVTLAASLIGGTPGGSVTNTSIVIPASLILGVVATTSSAKVVANALESAVVVVTA